MLVGIAAFFSFKLSRAARRATADQKPMGRLVSRWAGTGGLAGPAASPAPRPGPAAGGCAFSRMRGSASQAMRLHPCKLVCCHPWQHTVPPTHPCLPFDRGLVRNGKSRCLVPPLHWLAFVDSFASLTCLACSACLTYLVRLARSVRLICVTFSAQAPQHESPRPCPSAALPRFAMATSQLSGAWGVWVGGTVVPHGCGSRAPMDGFTARPANPHTPRLAQSSEKLCALGLALLALRPCICAKQSHRPTVGGYPDHPARLASDLSAFSVALRCVALLRHGHQPTVGGVGCVGWRDRCAAWMRLTSPHGWVYGASREPTHPTPGPATRRTLRFWR